MTDFWQRLKQRKLVQWALAYIAAAFALLQGGHHGATLRMGVDDRAESDHRFVRGHFLLALVPKRERQLSGSLIEGSDLRS